MRLLNPNDLAEIEKSKEEIYRVLDWAHKYDTDGSSVPEMSYEAGIMDMYYWLIGEYDDAPGAD